MEITVDLKFIIIFLAGYAFASAAAFTYRNPKVRNETWDTVAVFFISAVVVAPLVPILAALAMPKVVEVVWTSVTHRRIR